MSLIEVKNLHKIFQHEGVETHALRGLNFKVEKGEFISLMGPSGSGKSTLLHIIGLLDRHTKGSYKFNRKEVANYTDDEMAHIRNFNMGFVFQSFNLLARMTVYNNVKMPLLYSDIPEEKWDGMIRKVIDQVGLTDRIDYLASHLSGGERQRVAIARALVLDPDIIFADEPTGNLDTVSGQKVMKLLQELHENDGNTILLVTHETETAKHAERLIRLRDGQIELDEKIIKRNFAKHGFNK